MPAPGAAAATQASSLVFAMSHQPQAPPPAARNYSLQRLARYRLTQHLNPYKKQKRVKADDAPKTFDESDSLLSFPSTSSASSSNKRVNVPVEKVFEDAQHSLRIQLAQKELKHIPSRLAARFDLADTLFLDLSANSLTELPEFVSRLTRLRTLVARENRLGSRLEIRFHGLVYLDLSGNRLTALADSFFNSAQQLRILLLAGNRLESLNPCVSNLAPCLEELDLSSNLIVELPAQIGLLTNLRVLNVSNNQISILPREIGNLGQLSVFDVSLNRLERLPSSMWRIAVNARAQIAFRIDGNPLTAPPLHIVRRGRRHVGKFLRNLATKEHSSAGNIADISVLEDVYDAEFYKSHGICNGKMAERRQNRHTTSMFTASDSPSSVRRYVDSGDGNIPPWNVPLSVNTINTSSAFASSVNGAAMVCGTDSGYASTVDEHRFSHEFTCLSTAMSVEQTEKHANDLTPASRADENISPPTVPLLDLTSVAPSEVPINRARAINHIMEMTEKRPKIVDFNNNNSIYENNNNLVTENIKRTDITTTNGGVVGNRMIHIRYNGLHINNVDKHNSNAPLPSLVNSVNGAGGNRVILQRNGNLLVNLHGSLNNSTAKALSPLVERNENSWNSTTGELPPQPLSLPNSAPPSATTNNHTTENGKIISSDERPKSTAINSGPTASNVAKISMTAQKFNKDKTTASKQTIRPMTASSSSTLPRKKADITKMTSSIVSSTSNSSDNLTRIAKTSVTGSKLLSGSTTRLARSVTVNSNSTVSAVKPISRVTSSITARPTIKSSVSTAKLAKSTTETSSTTVARSAVSRSSNYRATSKPVAETKTSSLTAPANKMSKSTVVTAPIIRTAKSLTVKRAPIVTATPTRTVRGSSTAPKVEPSTQSQTLSQKSSSTMHLTRKVAPTLAIPSTNARTGSVTAKRH